MASATVTLIAKPGCHLCDEARGVVEEVVAGVDADRSRVVVEERSILDDEELRAKYDELIPVVLIDGLEHAHWRVEPEAFRTALAAAVTTD